MTVVYHPEFPQDIKKFEAQYREISARLGERFRAEVDKAIEVSKQRRHPEGIFWTLALRL
jgi:hypothetical protein